MVDIILSYSDGHLREKSETGNLPTNQNVPLSHGRALFHRDATLG